LGAVGLIVENPAGSRRRDGARDHCSDEQKRRHQPPSIVHFIVALWVSD
jgi:hypothetical protein